jgi:hypothetical protein
MDELLWRSGKRTTLLYWPAAVDDRLDVLHQLTAGENASRAQILATLVCAVPLDAESLGESIRAYRQLTLADFRADHPAPTRTARRPGPRRLE